MYLLITKKKAGDKIYQSAKIVESYKIDGKSRQKIIMPLGPINSNADLLKYKKILESMKKGNLFVNEKDIKAKNSKQYGITYAVNKLLEKYGLDEILKEELTDNKARFNIYEIIKALIINRLVKPSSELSTLEWIDEDYTENLNIKDHQIYRALDYLIPKKEIIEKKIFDSLKNKLNLDLSKSHYDLTSSYFEGKCCEIALYGYTRDHRKDRMQIVIGLVMIDGIPIHHEVYNGNTTDKMTLKNIKEDISKKFGIKETIIISDGGLITKENLEDLEDYNQKYLLGVPRRNNNMSAKYLIKEINSEKNQSAILAGREKITRDKVEYTRNFILCFDKNTRKERLKTLEEIKKKKEDELRELQKRYEKSQSKNNGGKITKESMINQAYKILGKNKRLFNIEEKEGKLIIFFIKNAYEYEKGIAGKFLIITNTFDTPENIMKSYKELQTVENAFDEIKNFLYIRPIFHYSENRVKAHVFLCMLSFLVESLIERFSKKSARVTLRELERIKIIKLDFKDKTKKLLTEISRDLEKIFYDLRIQKPLIL